MGRGCCRIDPSGTDRIPHRLSVMFAILPTSEDVCEGDAKWFTDLEQAYNSALDWSVELHGERVNVYEVRRGKFNPIARVFA